MNKMRRSQERYEREQMEKTRKMFDHHQAMLRANPQIVASVKEQELKAKQREGRRDEKVEIQKTSSITSWWIRRLVCCKKKIY